MNSSNMRQRLLTDKNKRYDKGTIERGESMKQKILRDDEESVRQQILKNNAEREEKRITNISYLSNSLADDHH